MRHTALAALAALSLGAGCKRDKVTGAPPTAETVVDFVAKPAAVDASKLVAPALFAHVPADTPYMVGSFEAIPLEYWSKLKDAVGPALASGYYKLRAEEAANDTGDETFARLSDAVLAELGGDWNARGVERLGFKAQPRFALYGLGLAPVVFRIEVGDAKTLLATIERVAKKAQLALPAQETHHGRAFWRVRDGGALLVIALVDDQLVVAGGPADAVEPALGSILGTEKPSQSMADGKLLAAIAATHGFGPHMIGFADTRLMVRESMKLDGRTPSAACTAALDPVIARAPRVVFGYTPLTGTTWSGGLVVELAPDAVAALRALKVEVPGLATAVTPTSLFAMGGGVDLERSRQLGVTAFGALRGVARACELADADEDLADIVDSLSRPLPPELAGIVGGAIAVDKVTVDPARPGMPQELEASAFISARDAKAVFAKLQKLPFADQLGITADGKLHPINVPVPLSVHGGVGARTIVVTAGTGAGKQLGEKLLAAGGSGKAPFMLMSYDYGRFLELQAQLTLLKGDDASALAEVEAEMNRGLSKMFGRVSASVDVGDKGLVFWGSMEVR